MTTPISEVREPLGKILKEIQSDRSLFRYTPSGDTKITAHNLETAAGNHLFDDHPEDFGISKREGHSIRVYFQGDSNYGFIEELHREFPEMMESEPKHYLQMVDKHRQISKQKTR